MCICMVTKFKNYAAKSTVEWEYPDQCFLREVDPARSSVFKSPGKMKSSETSEFLETTDDRTEPWMNDSIISSFILPMRFSCFSHIDNASLERAWQLSRFPKSLYMGSGFVREVDVERGRECGITR